MSDTIKALTEAVRGRVIAASDPTALPVDGGYLVCDRLLHERGTSQLNPTTDEGGSP